MTTFDLTNPFTFTLKDGDTEKELKGTFRELTKKEKETFKRKTESIEDTIKKGVKLTDKIKRNVRSIEIKEKLEDWKAVDKLTADTNKIEDELTALSDSFNPDKEREELVKERFELCLGGTDRDEIMELAEVHGFETVLNVILDAIREGKSSK